MPEERNTPRRVTGLKQTVRAVRSGEAKRVLLARDADEALLAPLRDLCRERGVPVTEHGSMKELGEFCGLAVGAAAAAVLG